MAGEKVFERQRDFELVPGHVYELLNDLPADGSVAALERLGDKGLSGFLLLWKASVEGVDECVGVEEAVSAHSSRLA